MFSEIFDSCLWCKILVCVQEICLSTPISRSLVKVLRAQVLPKSTGVTNGAGNFFSKIPPFHVRVGMVSRSHPQFPLRASLYYAQRVFSSVQPARNKILHSLKTA